MLGVHGFAARSFRGWLSGVAWLAVIVAVALLTAKWLTVLLSPRPVAVLATGPVPSSASPLEDALLVFGRSAGPDASRIDDLELTGVFADGRGGFATFASAAGPLSAVVGAEVRPGVTLVSVTGERAVLRGSGAEWQLEFRLPPDLPHAAGRPATDRR